MKSENRGNGEKPEANPSGSGSAFKKKPATLDDLLDEGQMRISKWERPPKTKPGK